MNKKQLPYGWQKAPYGRNAYFKDVGRTRFFVTRAIATGLGRTTRMWTVKINNTQIDEYFSTAGEAIAKADKLIEETNR